MTAHLHPAPTSSSSLHMTRLWWVLVLQHWDDQQKRCEPSGHMVQGQSPPGEDGDNLKEIVVDFGREHTQHPLLASAVERVSSNKYLGVHMSQNLSWNISTTFFRNWEEKEPRPLLCILSTEAPLRAFRTTASLCVTGSAPSSATRPCYALWEHLRRSLDIYHIRLTRKATRIAGDPTHPSQSPSHLGGDCIVSGPKPAGLFLPGSQDAQLSPCSATQFTLPLLICTIYTVHIPLLYTAFTVHTVHTAI